jgi:uncharacterized membrane protein YcfT
MDNLVKPLSLPPFYVITGEFFLWVVLFGCGKLFSSLYLITYNVFKILDGIPYKEGTYKISL